MNHLSDNQSHIKQQYERDGFAVFQNVLHPDLIQETSNHIDWLLEKHPELRPEHLHHRLVADDPFWVRLISDERLLDIAEIFVGSNIALFASHYISKPPSDGKAVLWHQDGSYWPLAPMEVVTLWLAVDDSTPENGCMRVIPGTHTMPIHQMKRRTDIPNVLNSEIDTEWVDESKAVDIVIKAGGISVHHPNLIHGSNPNTSTKRRGGLTIRYIPTSTRITSKEPWPCAFLLRGEAVAGLNSYRASPKYIEGEHMPFRGCESWK